MAFVDGEPIDAAKLGQLETDLNLLRSQIPKFGGSDSGSNLGQSTVDSSISTGPQIQAENLPTITIKPGPNVETFKFKKSFNKIPTVVVTPRYSSSGKQWHPAVNVTSISATGFTITCYMPTNTVKHDIGINYIAIAY